LRTVRAAALSTVRPRLTSTLHAQSVLDVVHTGHRLRDVFRAALIVAAVDVAGKSHFAILDCHYNFKRVEIIILAQPVVDVFANPLVGSAIVFWSTSAALFVLPPASLGVFITKPRSDRVRGAVPPAAFFTTTGAATFLIATPPLFAASPTFFTAIVTTAIVVAATVALTAAAFAVRAIRTEARRVVVTIHVTAGLSVAATLAVVAGRTIATRLTIIALAVASISIVATRLTITA
jgi:hypothetical protein